MKKINFVFTTDQKFNLFKDWWQEGGGQSIYKDFEIFHRQESNITYGKMTDNSDIIVFSEKISDGDLVEVELELENEVIKFLEAEANKENISIDELTSKILQKYLVKEALKNDK